MIKIIVSLIILSSAIGYGQSNDKHSKFSFEEWNKLTSKSLIHLENKTFLSFDTNDMNELIISRNYVFYIDTIAWTYIKGKKNFTIIEYYGNGICNFSNLYVYNFESSNISQYFNAIGCGSNSSRFDKAVNNLNKVKSLTALSCANGKGQLAKKGGNFTIVTIVRNNRLLCVFLLSNEDAKELF